MLQQTTVRKRTHLIFLLGFPSGCAIFGYSIYKNLFLGEPPDLGLVGMSVTLILGTTIMILAQFIEQAEKVFKEHGLDWKKEILDAKL